MLRQEFAQECPYDTMYSNLLKRQIGLSLMFWPAELKGVYDDWLRVPFIKAIGVYRGWMHNREMVKSPT